MGAIVSQSSCDVVAAQLAQDLLFPSQMKEPASGSGLYIPTGGAGDIARGECVWRRKKEKENDSSQT